MSIQKHCVYYRDDENKIYYYDNSNHRKYVNSTFYDKVTEELYYFDENGERHVIDIDADGYALSADVDNRLENVSAWANDTFVTSADLEPYAESEYVQDELGKKVDISAMSAYATSAWVDENFQPKGDYITQDELEAVLDPYAPSAWVDENFQPSGDYITPEELEAALDPYATLAWVNEELAKKQDASAMSAYAQSAWVDENFQPKGDYITPDELDRELEPYATSAWVQDKLDKKVDISTMSAYATSAWVDENFLKQADYHEYSAGNDYIRISKYKVYGYDWTSAVSAVPFKLDTSSFEDYSAWADDTYLKEKDLEGYATSAGLEPDQQYAMTNSGWAPVDIPDETVVSGTSGISAQKIGDSWIVGTSAQFATSGDIEEGKQFALTTSGWTEVQRSLELADSAIQGVKLHGAKTRITPDASNIVTIPIFSTDFPGLVPSATLDDADKVLKGDGTWGEAGSSVRISYDSVTEELHMDFSPIPTSVTIGDREYPIVQIGNQYWMEENLALDISGSITNAEHPEFGRYYNYFQMDAIPFPQGWRLATYSDLQSLDSNASHLSNRLLVSGDLGFNAMLCGQYHPNFGWSEVCAAFKMWSSTEYVTGNRYEISLYPNNSILIGFSTENYRPVRLVRDI